VQLQSLLLSISALASVLGLIWLIQRLLRAGRLRTAFAAWLPPPGRDPGRLRLVQSLTVDPRRRVLLIACDDREVLVLTGGPNDLLLCPAPKLAAAVAEPV
jgi:flagellar protein FliO/FliZ